MTIFKNVYTQIEELRQELQEDYLIEMLNDIKYNVIDLKKVCKKYKCLCEEQDKQIKNLKKDIVDYQLTISELDERLKTAKEFVFNKNS
jgi:predicted RNase H-like nuclease (RuvC/YqgF family)